MVKSDNKIYQAIAALPSKDPCFSLGICCNADEVTALDFLPAQNAMAPKTALAAEVVRQLNAYLHNPSFSFALPLQPQGTFFQRKVWQAIAGIPGGETRSYAALATALHSGPRAVGGACGANPYPLLIPCHRVIASGGGLGGFSRNGGEWLLDIKRWLLAHEGPRPA